MGYVPWHSPMPPGLPPEDYEEDLRRLRRANKMSELGLIVSVAFSWVAFCVVVWAAFRAM